MCVILTDHLASAFSRFLMQVFFPSQTANGVTWGQSSPAPPHPPWSAVCGRGRLLRYLLLVTLTLAKLSMLVCWCPVVWCSITMPVVLPCMLTQSTLVKTDKIFKMTFSFSFFLMKIFCFVIWISLKFIPVCPIYVTSILDQIIWLGTEQVTSHLITRINDDCH